MVQAAFIRLQQGEVYVAPNVAGGALAPEEQALLDAYRAATPKAQRLAVANLEDQPRRTGGSKGSAKPHNRRAGSA